jgi:hypothetical protein
VTHVSNRQRLIPTLLKLRTLPHLGDADEYVGRGVLQQVEQRVAVCLAPQGRLEGLQGGLTGAPGHTPHIYTQVFTPTSRSAIWGANFDEMRRS